MVEMKGDPSPGLLHGCRAAEEIVIPGTMVERLPFRTIDVHCHLFTPAVEILLGQDARRANELALQDRSFGATSTLFNREQFSKLLPRLTNAETRVADMDAMGIDLQVVSPSPTQYCYWADHDLAEEIARLQNEAVAQLCASHPDRFVGLGAVSLGHPHLAARQLETLVRDLGFKGAQISTMVGEVDLSDQRFDPFWHKAEELGAAIFIHPWGTTLGDRLATDYLANTIGQPFETTVCLSKLIFGGTFDRHQRLKILAAHGGGYLPNYIGRSDQARAVRPEACGCAYPPSGYLRRIWFDSLVYDAKSLRRLAEQVGWSQLVIGTDYPFDMGHYAPAALLEGLDPDIQQMVAGRNATELLSL